MSRTAVIRLVFGLMALVVAAYGRRALRSGKVKITSGPEVVRSEDPQRFRIMMFFLWFWVALLVFCALAAS